VIPVNDPPVLLQEIPDLEINEDELLNLFISDYFMDPDGDSLTFSYTYVIDNHGSDIAFPIIEDDTLRIFFWPDSNGLADVYFGFTDGEFDIWEDFITTIISIHDPSREITTIGDRSIFKNTVLSLFVPEFVYDPDGDVLNYSVKLNSQYWSVSNDTLTITPDSNYIGTFTNIVITAHDQSESAELTGFNLEVLPTPIVHFVMKDYFTYSTLVSDTCSWWIGDQTFQTTNGELTVQLGPGTYEFSATNPMTADDPDDINPFFVDFNTFLRRPSDTECFEQRADDDYSSPITIANDDTIHVYKIMYDIPFMHGLLLYVDPEGVGTVRFSEDDLQAPAW